MRAQAVKVIGEARYEPALDALIAALADGHDRVRFQAGIALGKLGEARALEPLLAMLAEHGEDPFLRHAGMMGLKGCGSSERLAGLSGHDARPVRLAAVVAMRRLGDAAVARFLADRDELVVTEAARAIHDDASIPEALPALAKLLPEIEWSGEALLRRAINANLRLGERENAERLAAYAGRASGPAEMRAEALRCLAAWADPPELDRVEGCWRPVEGHEPAVAAEALEPTARALLTTDANAPAPVRIAAAEAVGTLEVASLDDALVRLVSDDQQSTALRVASLAALGRLGGEPLSDAVRVGLESSEQDLREEARRRLAGIDGSGETAAAVLDAAVASGRVGEKQAALETLAEMDSDAAAEVIGRWMDRLLAGEVPRAIRLDILEAARASERDALAEKVERYERSLPDDESLAEWEVALYGGDAEAGREILAEHVSAQCLRCHAIDGEGGEVAPDLTGIAGRVDRRHMLESLIRPGAEIAEGYAMVSLTLEDGSTVAGTLGEETDEQVTVQLPSGETRHVAKEEIAQRQSLEASAMPPMGSILSKSELRDVIAYLATLE